jgi:hypothetical protein
MRTTIELPDDLLALAKVHAAQNGISLKELFIDAISRRLSGDSARTRRTIPVVGGPDSPRIGVLTPEQIDEAMFG